MILVSAILYMIGMQYLEGSPRTFWHSVGFAAETLSTTGYGADTGWQNPLMVIFTVTLQFIGVFFVFLIIPVYLVPFLGERFEKKLPREAPPDMKDHIVIFKFSATVENSRGESLSIW